MNKKILILGPWVGEFSYEISWWIPQVRELVLTKYSDYYVIALSSLGRKKLYEDFIDEFLPHPEYLEIYLSYPSMAYQYINGEEIIPLELTQYTTQIKEYCESQSELVELILPRINMQDALNHNPPGLFSHYKSSDIILKKVKDKLNNYFNDDKDIILILAREKIRNGVLDKENWDPLNWGKFITSIIEKLKLNIVLFGIPNKESKGGTISFESLGLNDKHKKNVLYYPLEGKDSVEEQIALLQNTKCSVYGATGAATLAFFTNTPIFTQQTSKNGYRLDFSWQHNLTNNHKKVKIFDKYSEEELYNSPPEELYNEFKNFYKKL